MTFASDALAWYSFLVETVWLELNASGDRGTVDKLEER